MPTQKTTLPTHFSEEPVYVTDSGNRLVGVVDIKEILQAKLDEALESI
jgi:Mg/Co/Ni transporter MgtE